MQGCSRTESPTAASGSREEIEYKVLSFFYGAGPVLATGETELNKWSLSSRANSPTGGADISVSSCQAV